MVGTVVVTENTTQILLGTLDNGRKVVLCTTTENAANVGESAEKALPITVGNLTRIDGFFPVLETDSDPTIGAVTYAARGNVITATAATGLAATKTCAFRVLVIGT